MKLFVTLCLFSPLVSGAPSHNSSSSVNETSSWFGSWPSLWSDTNNSSSGNETSNSEWTGWLPTWGQVQEILPGSVSSYLEETASEGVKVINQIYNETRQSAVETSEVQLDEVANILEKFIQKLESLYQSAKRVVEEEIVLTDAEIQARKDAGDLEGTKEELDRLKEVLVKEREENEKFEGVEAILQKLITTARDLLSSADSQADLGWSKLKQLELEFYQASQLVANTSGQVKEALEEAFNTFNEELEEASPALRRFVNIASFESVSGAGSN